MTADDRQPWELADEGGRPRKEVPLTSEPIEEQERGEAEARTRGNGTPAWNEEDGPPVTEEEKGSRHADEDAEEHSEPKGPAGAAGGPR